MTPETIIGRTIIPTLRLAPNHAPDGETVVNTNDTRTIRPCVLDGCVQGFLVEYTKTAQRRFVPAINVVFAEWSDPEAERVLADRAAALEAEYRAAEAARAAQEAEEARREATARADISERRAAELAALRKETPIEPRQPSKQDEEPPPEDDDIPPEMSGFVSAAEKRAKRR